MRLAIAASRAALQNGDEPYGATLATPDGRALLVALNNQNSTHDCTAHAEMVLVRRALDELGPESLQGATVYASGEPCAMCAGALYWAGVAHVVYAVSQPEMAGLLNGRLLPARAEQLLGTAEPPVPVTGGLMHKEAMAVLQEAAAMTGPPGLPPMMGA